MILNNTTERDGNDIATPNTGDALPWSTRRKRACVLNHDGIVMTNVINAMLPADEVTG